MTREGFVSFDSARYGVPWRYNGREVRVRVLDSRLEIYDGQVLIVIHEIQNASRRIVWLPIIERHFY